MQLHTPLRQLRTRIAGKNLLLLVVLLALVCSRDVAAHPGAEASIELISQQIEQQPDDQRLHIRRAEAYSHGGQYQLALDDLQRAQTLGPANETALTYGLVYFRNKELEPAKHWLDRHLDQYPDDIVGLEYRARLLRDMGDFSASIADYMRLFALHQVNPGDYLSAAQMMNTIAGRGTDDALALLDQGLVQLGMIPQLQHYAIELESQRGNYPAALSRLQSLEPALGASPQWKVDLAVLLSRMNRPAESRRWYLAARQQLQGLRVTPARLALQAQVETALLRLASD